MNFENMAKVLPVLTAFMSNICYQFCMQLLNSNFEIYEL